MKKLYLTIDKYGAFLTETEQLYFNGTYFRGEYMSDSSVSIPNWIVEKLIGFIPESLFAAEIKDDGSYEEIDKDKINIY